MDRAVADAYKWTTLDRPWDFLKREEKAVMGVGIEREVCQALGWPRGVFSEYNDGDKEAPDTVVAGIHLEFKSSTRTWFGMRKKQIGHWSIMYDVNPTLRTYRVGLLFVEEWMLTKVENDASKKSISKIALENTRWIIDGDFGRFVLSEQALMARLAA